METAARAAPAEWPCCFRHSGPRDKPCGSPKLRHNLPWPASATMSSSSPPPFFSFLLVQGRGRRPLTLILRCVPRCLPRCSGGIQATYYTMKREWFLTQCSNNFTTLNEVTINTDQSTNRTGTTRNLLRRPNGHSAITKFI
jgi:hypothetical protein